MTKEKVLARLAKSRQAMHQATQGLSEEEMTQTQVEGVWTIKDVIGHVASWEETFLEPLRRYVDGGPFKVEVVEDYMAWNDEQAARKQPIPLDAILDESATIRQGLVDAAGRLSDEQWEQQVPFPWGGEGTVPQALAGLSQHEMEHVHTVQQWREG
jgi:uncharacterized damage-inducible protein DinB